MDQCVTIVCKRYLDIFKDYVRDLDSILLREDIFGFKICTIGHVGSSLQ